MPVEKVGWNSWQSTLIPGQIFDSYEAAEHYDRREEMKLNAGAVRNEELLAGLSPEAIKNLVNAVIGKAGMNNAETEEFCNREFNRFTAKNPRFVISEENSRRLSAFLYGAGYHPPFSCQQYQDAFDVLSVQYQLDLHDIRQTR